jgi:phytoene dehydrogenase-like protein
LADGTEIRTDVVVSNINAKTLYQSLIGYERLPWLVQRGVRSYRYDNACPMVYLGLDYVPPLTAHHTFIAPTLPEINGWWRRRVQQPIPHQQFGMIDWPTFSDPALAPEGKHVLNEPSLGPIKELTGTGTRLASSMTSSPISPGSSSRPR